MPGHTPAWCAPPRFCSLATRQDEDRKRWRHNRARCRGGWAPVSVLGLRRRRRWERARDGGMCLGLDPGWTSPAGDGGGDGARDAGPSCSVGEQRPPSLDQMPMPRSPSRGRFGRTTACQPPTRRRLLSGFSCEMATMCGQIVRPLATPHGPATGVYLCPADVLPTPQQGSSATRLHERSAITGIDPLALLVLFVDCETGRPGHRRVTLQSQCRDSGVHGDRSIISALQSRCHVSICHEEHLVLGTRHAVCVHIN